MSINEEYDVIIAGGGAAGCVVAGRLAAASPELSILLIEAGRNNLNDPSVIHPANYLSHLLPTSTTATFHVGRESKELAGRQPIVPTGNILGGGSSINFMMYSRALASDYDDWKTEGWTGKDLLPLLKKTETYHLENKDPELHGFDGPLHVSYGGYRHEKIMNEYLDVAKGRGFPVVDDLQDLKTADAFERWGKWINPTTGRRSDAAHGFVHPQIGKSGLQLLCESKVSRVIVENGKAVGVEYVPAVKPEGEVKPKTVRARKLVVVSAGTLGSPPILERSGIGAKEVLAKAGVECVAEVPGVGTNYQDHNIMLSGYRVAPGTDTQDDFLKGVPEVHAQAAKEFESGKGKYATNFIDCGGRIRPNEKELKEMGPEFGKFWKEYFENAPDKGVICVVLLNSLIGDYSVAPPGPYVTMGSFLNYPASRGSIHITSTNPYDAADLDPGFLSHEADLAPNMWIYKVTRELVRRMPSYRGEPVGFHPKFAIDSPARCNEIDFQTSKELMPEEMSAGAGPKVIGLGQPEIKNERKETKDIQDIVYSKEDDKAVEQWIRENLATTWHSMGTLAMKPKEDGGVVDKNLNVYGVQNLKIADLSICPENVGSNTYSTALVVGEKAAVLCGEHLGLTNV